jgi:hypothetical protein
MRMNAQTGPRLGCEKYTAQDGYVQPLESWKIGLEGSAVGRIGAKVKNSWEAESADR